MGRTEELSEENARANFELSGGQSTANSLGHNINSARERGPGVYAQDLTGAEILLGNECVPGSLEIIVFDTADGVNEGSSRIPATANPTHARLLVPLVESRDLEVVIGGRLLNASRVQNDGIGDSYKFVGDDIEGGIPYGFHDEGSALLVPEGYPYRYRPRDSTNIQALVVFEFDEDQRVKLNPYYARYRRPKFEFAIAQPVFRAGARIYQ